VLNKISGVVTSVPVTVCEFPVAGSVVEDVIGHGPEGLGFDSE
jgi:hypothetical protein